MQKTIQKLDLCDDAMFKAIIRSEEAKEVITEVLSLLSGIALEKLKKASFEAGEMPKLQIDEKAKISDIHIRIDHKNIIIIEMNHYYHRNLLEKNSSYAFANYVAKTKAGTNTYPNVTLINIDDYNPFGASDAVIEFKIRDKTGTYTRNAKHIVLFILYLKMRLMIRILKISN